MKIRDKFDQFSRAGEMLFMPYITAGYPSLDESMDALHTLADNGADIIELGIPFSDPIADGPTIQYSSQIALQSGITLEKILNSLRNTKINKPIVLMSYLNPFLAYGKENLFSEMKEIGISGIIVPDMPAEESNEWLSLSNQYDIDVIFLVAPTSSDDKIRFIAERSKAYIYLVSITGTTGAREKLPADIIEFVRRVKRITNVPVAVGFGISTSEQIASLRGEADGIIIGSRMIEAIRRKENLGELVRKFKEATKA